MAVTIGVQTGAIGGVHNLDQHGEMVFASLAKSGFAAVEGGPTDAKAAAALLAKHHLKYAGSHTVVRPLVEKTAELVAYLKAVGGHDVCNSGLFDWKHATMDQYRENIAMLNKVGAELKREGIRLHYHNHDFEFLAPIEGAPGRRGIDVLIEGLDPAACDLCVDVAWVLRGNDDPVSFLKKHAAIVGYLHLKDWNGTDWVELGRGNVDIKGVMELVRAGGLPKVQWAVVEQDKCAIDPLESMKISRDYLKSIGW